MSFVCMRVRVCVRTYVRVYAIIPDFIREVFKFTTSGLEIIETCTGINLYPRKAFISSI